MIITDAPRDPLQVGAACAPRRAGLAEAEETAAGGWHGGGGYRGGGGPAHPAAGLPLHPAGQPQAEHAGQADHPRTCEYCSIGFTQSPVTSAQHLPNQFICFYTEFLSAFYVLTLSTNEKSSHREQLQEGN